MTDRLRAKRRSRGADIDLAIRNEDWPRARRLLLRALQDEPRHHWYWTRLGLTFYEQHRYAEALPHERKALSIAPRCPLVLWDYAGTLQMLRRHREALAVYGRLLRRGVDRIAHGECGEGISWTRGLIADCHYRRAQSYEALGNRRAARRDLARHLAMRGPGCRSIYPLTEVRRRQRRLAKNEEEA